MEGEVLVVCPQQEISLWTRPWFCVLSVRHTDRQTVHCRQTVVIVQDYHEERLCSNSGEVYSVYLTAYVNHFMLFYTSFTNAIGGTNLRCFRK